ncbi:MAG: hypothetical protein GTN78_05950, partial [Gemmatimonadales bacterium]|nr:hypothetical protein [Gemmatimonadales bacterium]
IERDTDGNPTAISAPHGQRTLLTLDPNGYLASVTNPADETTQFGYTSEGLLSSLTDPRDNIHSFFYDGLGRLVRDEDPASGWQALGRSEDGDGYQVTRSTALTRSTTYRVESLPGGDRRWLNTLADGTQSEVLIGTDGSRRT